MSNMSRRTALGTITAGVAGAVSLHAAAEDNREGARAMKGRIKQSVSRWCLGGVSLEDLAGEGAAMGLVGIDLLGMEEAETVKSLGLTCTMVNGPGGIAQGWNDPANHESLITGAEDLLPKVAAAGLRNMIVLSGNRWGRSDSEGLTNCVTGLKQIMPLAEQLGVTVCMELLNSKRDHADYMADRTPWGVELVQRLGSSRFKLLYDIYHMQIMEGDIIATIQENIDHIGHFHTGGVPGRHELDDTQELNYRRIMEVIAETDFDGFVAHEFVPQRDPLTSLREAVKLCDV